MQILSTRILSVFTNNNSHIWIEHVSIFSPIRICLHSTKEKWYGILTNRHPAKSLQKLTEISISSCDQPTRKTQALCSVLVVVFSKARTSNATWNKTRWRMWQCNNHSVINTKCISGKLVLYTIRCNNHEAYKGHTLCWDLYLHSHTHSHCTCYRWLYML